MFVPPAIAQSRRPAGYVVAVETPEGAPAPLVRREGQTLDAQVWTPLFAGDAVEAQGAAALTIETAKDKRLRVDPAASPHRVTGELGGRFAAFAASLGELFRAKPEARATALVGRSGEPPRFALGAARCQRVAAGAPLWAGWRGGTAPFTLSLVGQSDKRNRDLRALASVATPEQGARLTVPAGAAGRLTLVLRDAEGREARAALTVGPAPALPGWIAQAAPSRETATLAQAAELLARKPARHDFHAAGLLAAQDDAPARAFLARLLRGARAP
jgi:hypothetical protein